MPDAIATDGVSVRLGGLQILDSVSIAAEQGVVTGLIGPNGAGKTTLFNVMSGFVTPDSGSVSLDGTRLRRIRPHALTRHGIARTLQGVGLFGSLSALQNVMLGARSTSGIVADALALPWSDAEQRKLAERARVALDALGIADCADRLPGELPYPVQKRVALARALVSDPKVLLLDEPAGGISAGDIADLAALIRSWVPQRTVLLVEHHMELVLEAGVWIWVLDAGKVIADGPPDVIRRDPAVLAAYLGEEGAA